MNYISKRTTTFVISRKKLDALRNKKPTKEYIKEKEALKKARDKDSELGEYVYNITSL